MKVLFNAPREIDGKSFEKGTHFVDSKFKDHWFFLGLVEAGDAVVVDPNAEPDEEEIARQEALKLPNGKKSESREAFDKMNSKAKKPNENPVDNSVDKPVEKPVIPGSQIKGKKD